MEIKNASRLLLAVCVILSLGALVTLIPYGGASKLNAIGYKSVCTFAPVSTIIMLFLANTLNGIRKKKFKV